MKMNARNDIPVSDKLVYHVVPQPANIRIACLSVRPVGNDSLELA